MRVLVVLVCGLALALTAAPSLGYDWLQYNGDAQHSGNNRLEHTIDASNVSRLTRRYQVALPEVADSTPVFLEGVQTAPGVFRDLIYVTTKAGHLVALDATGGGVVWGRQNGPGGCVIVNNGGGACYTNSSPAIDPNRLYVYTYGLDGFAHKYRVGDGVEITSGGWPQLVTLKGYDEKTAGALAIATAGGMSYLYVVSGGYPGDNGDYQGHVTTIDLATGTQTVFNTMCSNVAQHLAHLDANCSSAVRSAVWSRPGVIYHAALNRTFFATGNGSYNTTTHWSESVLGLQPDGTGVAGKPIDSYTPANFQSLDNTDADLGSTAPAILPVPANSNVQHLAVQGGKDGQLRLLDLANLSGQAGPGHTGGAIGSNLDIPQGGALLSQPAVWVNPGDQSTWVFVATLSGISGLKLVIAANGTPSLAMQWQKSAAGFSPLVANNIVYYAGDNALRALDPLTGNTLFSSSQIGGIHLQSPVVANGSVYVLDNNGNLSAFSLPPALGLGYVPISPCRIVDTRNVGGPIVAGATRTFNFYNDVNGWSWATSQGGTAGVAATVCPGTMLNAAGGTLGTVRPSAAVLTFTVVNPTTTGNFIAWGGNPPKPEISVLNWSAPAQVVANTTTVAGGGRNPGVQDFAVRYNGPTGQADVIVDVVGYYVDNAGTALQCVPQTAAGVGSHAGNTAFSLDAPSCGAGYTAIAYGCSKVGALPAGIYLQELAPTASRCTWFNNSGSAFAASNYRVETICCRVPGS